MGGLVAPSYAPTATPPPPAYNPPGNYIPRGNPPNSFTQPRKAEEYGDRRDSRQFDQNYWLGEAGRGMLGLGGEGSPPLTRGDLAKVQLGLYAQNQQLSEQDRAMGYGELERAWAELGQSPEALLSKELASERAQTGPFDQAYMEQGRGQITDSGAAGVQAALDAMASEQARRGVGGSSFAARDKAMLEQQAGLDMQQQLTDFGTTTTSANEQAQRAALDQLMGWASGEQSQRAALDQSMANVFLDTERGEPNLTDLAANMKKKNKVV